MDWRSPEYWRNLRPVAVGGWPEEHPAPQVTTRDPRPPEAPPEPLAVRRLVALASGAGWRVRTGYSIGDHRAVKIGTYRRVECFVVAGVRPPWRWYVAYERLLYTVGAGGFKVVRTAIWRTDGLPVAGPSSMLYFVDAGVTDMQEFIGFTEDPKPLWFKEIHARKALANENAKIRAQNAAKRNREGQS